MKAIGRLLAGCTVCTLVLGHSVTAVAGSWTVGISVSHTCMGQADPSSPAERKRQSDMLLELARQAMKEGNLVLAERHVVRAEQLGAKYSTDKLLSRFEDNPTKVRRDLNVLKAKNGIPVTPSSRSTPFVPGAASATPATPPPAPYGADREAALNKMVGGAKAKATDYLARGRRALDQKDLLAATAWWQKAVSQGARFQPNEYSPDKLAAALRAAGVSAERLTVQGRSTGFEMRPGDVAKSDLQRLPPPATAANPTMGPRANTITSPHQIPTERNPLLADAKPTNKQQAQRYIAEGTKALEAGDVAKAQQLARQAQQLAVPDNAFRAGETRPWELQLKVDQAVRQRTGHVAQAANYTEEPSATRATASMSSYPVKQGVYDPGNDPTRIRRAQAEGAVDGAGGMQLYQEGLRALEAQDRQRANELFRQAWQFESELDPITRQQLRDKLMFFEGGAAPREPSQFEQIDSRQNLLRQQLYHEISSEERAAEQQFQTDPKGARDRLQRVRDRVAQSDLDSSSRNQLLTLVDRRINEFETYIDQHQAELELDEKNRAITNRIERDRAVKIEVQEQLAVLVDKFNTLLEEQRFAEADVIAKQVRELDPNSPFARTLILKSSFVKRMEDQEWIDTRAEDNFVSAMQSVDESRIPFDDREPMQFGDARRWSEITDSRRAMIESQRRRLSPVELQIQESLKQQVDVRFTNRPLKEVLEDLASITGVNIHLDAEGMSAEGVSSDTPVTINLSQAISLRSALSLILEPLRLSYVVQHEVLRITSEQARDANVYTEVYNVADLVIPIPNFVQGYNTGLPAAIREAHRSLGYGGVVQPSALSPMMASNGATDPNASVNPSILAQTNAYGMLPGSGGRPTQLPGSPAAAGGAALADFDTLIELITSTVEPESWDTIGGPGAIERFPTNLSLVISQTQDVHDQIADLLEQLRRLQDLQVTIEVRFITLQDNWFERIGVDFDFDIDDNVLTVPRDDSGNSVTIGLDQAGPTADLDLSFTQGSFGLAAPAFGGFQAQNAANFGFAILSDIEAFFLLQAATGDTRSNVLQAPKVTLFNGQQASVNDASQRPFVTSLIPVVGDFAAAHQPVIVVLSEGTSLNVQAVVSSDRRFVRLTLQPVFSQIGNVETFTFQGTTTTDTGTNVVDADGNSTGDVDNVTNSTVGTTVQLPTFSFTTVSTTVSVPDGGTILLGGIKRLQEGRNEHGVPMLSKIPYVNRLFRNVGIGRTTQSLMLMVTPRIIIQEEEEEALGMVQE